MRGFWLVTMGLAMSSAIAAVAAGFLITENWLADTLWQNTAWWWQLVVIAVLAVALYALRRRWPNLTANAKMGLARLKDGRLTPHQTFWVNLAMTLVILTAGAGVGPEAALLFVVLGWSLWEGDKLRYLYFQYPQWRRHPWRLLHPTAYLQAYDAKIAANQWLKRLVVGLLITNGLVVVKLLLAFSDQPSFVTQLGRSHWQWSMLWVALPCLMVAGGYALLDRWLQRLLAKLSMPLWAQVVLGGVAILIVAQVAPVLLFSGQHSVHVLLHQIAPWLLTFWAVGKLVFLRVCLQCGWVGGEIFPVLFVGLSQGFALAAWLPQVDALLVVALTTVMIMTALMHRPAIAAVMTAVFCPLKLWPLIALTAGGLAVLQSRRHPKGECK